MSKDELIRETGQFSGIAPANTFAGAAKPDFSTSPAIQPTGEIVNPRGPVREYGAPASNLPVSVSAREIARQSAARGDNNWPGDPATAPILAGTRVTGDDLDLPGSATGRAIAEGKPGEVVENIAEGIGSAVSGVAGLAVAAVDGRRGRR